MKSSVLGEENSMQGPEIRVIMAQQYLRKLKILLCFLSVSMLLFESPKGRQWPQTGERRHREAGTLELRQS